MNHTNDDWNFHFVAVLEGNLVHSDLKCEMLHYSTITKISLPLVNPHTQKNITQRPTKQQLHLKSGKRPPRNSTHLPHGIKPKGIGLASVLFAIGRVQCELLPVFQVLNGGIGVDVPRWSENVEGLGEDVVVYNASVDGEAGHEEDDVTTAKEDVPDLGGGI